MIPNSLLRQLQILDRSPDNFNPHTFSMPLTYLGGGFYRRVYHIEDTNYVLKVAKGEPTIFQYSRRTRNKWQECRHSGGFISNIREFWLYKFKRRMFEKAGITLAEAHWLSKRGKFLIAEYVDGDHPSNDELDAYLGINNDCDEEDEFYDEREALLEDAHYNNWVVNENGDFIFVDYAGCTTVNMLAYAKHPFKELKNV